IPCVDGTRFPKPTAILPDEVREKFTERPCCSRAASMRTRGWIASGQSSWAIVGFGGTIALVVQAMQSLGASVEQSGSAGHAAASTGIKHRDRCAFPPR